VKARRHVAPEPCGIELIACPICDGSGVIARPSQGARFEWTCTNCIGLGAVPAPVQANMKDRTI
jgi:DnaJ-class molecular chaperone